MRGSISSRWASLALFSAVLMSATALARAEGPPPVAGGTVPSTLTLSLGEPSTFKRTGTAPEGDVYTSVIHASVTATDAPVRLGVETETPEGGRHGDPFSASFSPQVWSDPVANAESTIRLRQVAPSRRALRGNRNKLLLVTLTAEGP